MTSKLLVGRSQNIVLGPPGCGKTTELLRRMEEAMAAGVPPNKIAYCSFTKKAVNEAVSRACSKFGFEPKDLPYFRTIHSLSFKETGTRRSDVMGRHHYRELAGLLGVEFTGYYEQDGLPTGSKNGDKLLFMDGYARITMRPLKDVWQEFNDPEISWFELDRFSRTLVQYKNDLQITDFTDMLTEFVDNGQPLDVAVAFMDEAQDLSRLQWRVAEIAFSSADVVHIAGDDDQSIFSWSGADVETFLSLNGEPTVLNQSHRLPRRIYDLATKVISRVSRRYEKTWQPRDDDGEVDHEVYFDNVEINPAQTTMVLCRNAFQLGDVEETLKRNGHVFIDRKGRSSVNEEHLFAIRQWERLRRDEAVLVTEARVIYDHMRSTVSVRRGGKAALNEAPDDDHVTMEHLKTSYGLLTDGIWHDALTGISVEDREYYLQILRRGGSITKKPDLMVGTIHSVKGGEADHVILFTDMARRTHEHYLKHPDDEHRVMYVGVTRARNKLTVIQPQTPRYYPMG